MSYSSNAWNDALSEVGDGGVIAKILGVAYDSARFKRYACDVKAAKGWKEDAANQVIYQAATKMTVQGGGLGIFGGLAALGAGGTDITSLMYHIVEMCGVLAEIYGLDTSDDTVKAFVLAGASGDSDLTDRAFKLAELGMMNAAAREAALKPLIKTLLVPILKALGIKVGVRGGIKFAELIPVAGAIVGGGTNCYMVNSTGHKFLDKLKRMK